MEAIRLQGLEKWHSPDSRRKKYQQEQIHRNQIEPRQTYWKNMWKALNRHTKGFRASTKDIGEEF